jgi:hypothetical protein
MTNPLEQLGQQIKTLGGEWAKVSVVGTFLLYVVGYLTLRFHLTAMGVATDLAVLDERYLFTGARFLVYTVSSVPNIVLVALPFALILAVLRRVVPEALAAATAVWLQQPKRLALVGILFSVFMIQIVMRQCFLFNDLLLAHALPLEPAWLVALLLDDRLMPVYFSLLVAACAVTLALLWPLLADGGLPPALQRARALLGFLAAVQILLLPINYGVLIADKSLARVVAAGARVLAPGESAWLVWEGKDGVTFLLRSADGQRRTLLTQPRTQAPSIEVLGFDRILPALFRGSGPVRESPGVKP